MAELPQDVSRQKEKPSSDRDIKVRMSYRDSSSSSHTPNSSADVPVHAERGPKQTRKVVLSGGEKTETRFFFFCALPLACFPAGTGVKKRYAEGRATPRRPPSASIRHLTSHQEAESAPGGSLTCLRPSVKKYRRAVNSSACRSHSKDAWLRRGPSSAPPALNRALVFTQRSHSSGRRNKIDVFKE